MFCLSLKIWSKFLFNKLNAIKRIRCPGWGEDRERWRIVCRRCGYWRECFSYSFDWFCYSNQILFALIFNVLSAQSDFLGISQYIDWDSLVWLSFVCALAYSILIIIIIWCSTFERFLEFHLLELAAARAFWGLTHQHEHNFRFFTQHSIFKFSKTRHFTFTTLRDYLHVNNFWVAFKPFQNPSKSSDNA